MTSHRASQGNLVAKAVAALAGVAALGQIVAPSRPQGSDRTEAQRIAEQGALPAVTGFKAAVERFQQGHPLLSFPLAVVRKFGDDQAGRLAALVAYFGFFSLFPLLLAMVSILGIVLDGRPDLVESVKENVYPQIPGIGDQLRDSTTPLTGSYFAVAVGIAGALWGGLKAIDAAQDALNEVWDVSRVDYPKLPAKKLRSATALASVGLLLVGSAIGLQLLAQLPIPGGSKVMLQVAGVLVNAAVFLLSFKIMTATRLAWRDHLPGALLAGVFYVILQALGQWYFVRTAENAEGTYGTFAVVIGLLSWFFLLAQLVTLAVEVNVVAARRLWPRSLFKGTLTEADRRVLADAARTQKRRADEHIRVEFG
ncbi:MAG: YihY/virulence factor BrkB family protein [Acidimicrobiia bacterium]|nr:YihY/virulence factor BrkB family protein [Acidimicrobiia bacterium]